MRNRSEQRAANFDVNNDLPIDETSQWDYTSFVFLCGTAMTRYRTEVLVQCPRTIVSGAVFYLDLLERGETQ